MAKYILLERLQMYIQVHDPYYLYDSYRVQNPLLALRIELQQLPVKDLKALRVDETRCYKCLQHRARD